MAVMENIREGANNPWMKALFAVIVLVFVFWGIGASGPQSQVIAKVNGERITDTEFQRLMRNISRSQGDAASDEEQRQVAQQAIQQLIQQEVMLQEADANNIIASPDEIARYVLQVDAFKDSDGKFSDTLYKRTLKRMGLTQGKFEEQIRQQLVLQKLTETAVSGIRVSTAQVKQSYLSDQVQVTLKMVRIPESNLLDDVKVDEATLGTFVTANEGEIRTRYEADYTRLYKKSPRAQLRQIVLKTEGDDVVENPRVAMEKILAEARTGADFAELARTHSQDITASNGGSLGTVAQEQLSPAMVQAVFEAEPGTITDIITTNDGLVLASIEALFPAEDTPFDDVKTSIARTLTAEQNVGPLADEFAAKVLAAWKDGGSAPDELLAEQGVVALVTPPFPLGAPTFPGLSDSAELLQALGNAISPGLLGDVYPVVGGRIVAEVLTLEKPTESDFEAEKNKILRQTEARARQAFVTAWQEDLVQRATVEQFWQP